MLECPRGFGDSNGLVVFDVTPAFFVIIKFSSGQCLLITTVLRARVTEATAAVDDGSKVLTAAPCKHDSQVPFIRRGELSAGEAMGLMLPRDVGSRFGRCCVGLGWGVAFCSETFGHSWSDGSPKLLDRWELAQNLPTSIVKACPGIF